MDISREAAYPGERTGAWVEAGEVIDTIRESTIAYTHSDGDTYDIKLYLLADGRGWVHDFDSKKPCSLTISLISRADSHTNDDHEGEAGLQDGLSETPHSGETAKDKSGSATPMAPPDPDLDDTCGFLTLTGEADGYLDENVYGTYVLMDTLPFPGFGGMNTYTGIFYANASAGGDTTFSVSQHRRLVVCL